jgi:hypothetical protein
MSKFFRALTFIVFLSGVAILWVISFGFLEPTIQFLAMALMLTLGGGILFLSEEILKK